MEYVLKSFKSRSHIQVEPCCFFTFQKSHTTEVDLATDIQTGKGQMSLQV